MIDYKNKKKWTAKKQRTSRKSPVRKSLVNVSRNTSPAFQPQTQNRKAPIKSDREPLRELLPTVPRLLPWILFGFVGIWLAIGLVRGVGETLRVPLMAVEVVGAKRLKPTEVMAVAGIGEGMRVIDMDPFSISQEITNHPQVKNASVRRIFPGGLRITLQERVPFAVLTDGRFRNVLISHEGIILRSLGRGETAADGMPVLLMDGFPMQLGHRLTLPALHEGIALIGQLEFNGIQGQGAPRVDLRNTRQIGLELPGLDFDFLLPAEVHPTVFKQLQQAMILLEQDKKDVKLIDLRASDPRHGGRLLLR